MNLDDLTIGEAKELASMFGGGGASLRAGGSSIVVGTNVLIRTVTMHYTGQIKSMTDTDVHLTDAAWIADTGRYSNALATGELAEVEPYPNGVIVARGAIVDVAPWNHPLPREVK